jgi:hypothetical protein
MSILYFLITKNLDVVLYENIEYNGNFQQIIRTLLRKIHPNSKYKIDYDKYKVHYLNERNITYLCLTEILLEDLAFAFLEDIKKFYRKI